MAILELAEKLLPIVLSSVRKRRRSPALLLAGRSFAVKPRELESKETQPEARLSAEIELYLKQSDPVCVSKITFMFRSGTEAGSSGTTATKLALQTENAEAKWSERVVIPPYKPIRVIVEHAVHPYSFISAPGTSLEVVAQSTTVDLVLECDFEHLAQWPFAEKGSSDEWTTLGDMRRPQGVYRIRYLGGRPRSLLLTSTAKVEFAVTDYSETSPPYFCVTLKSQMGSTARVAGLRLCLKGGGPCVYAVLSPEEPRDLHPFGRLTYIANPARIKLQVHAPDSESAKAALDEFANPLAYLVKMANASPRAVWLEADIDDQLGLVLASRRKLQRPLRTWERSLKRFSTLMS